MFLVFMFYVFNVQVLCDLYDCFYVLGHRDI